MIHYVTGCERESSGTAKNKNDEVNGSHDNKTFQPDDDDDDAMKVVIKTRKDDESQKQNLEIEESAMHETSGL